MILDTQRSVVCAGILLLITLAAGSVFASENA